MVDANRHVNSSIQAGIVLNTPFCIIRTINKKSVKKCQKQKVHCFYACVNEEQKRKTFMEKMIDFRFEIFLQTVRTV